MKRKNVLFVNWGTRDKIYPFEVAKRKGLNIFLATTHNYPPWIDKFVSRKRLIFTNPYDSEKLIVDVLSFMVKQKMVFDAITTFFEMSMSQTADLAFALGYRFISPRAVRQSSANKLLMRLVCQRNKIATPKFAVFDNVGDGFKALVKIGVPAILKPVKSGHSFGVIVIDRVDKNEFGKMFARARKQLDTNADEWMAYYGLYKNNFLLEEYLNGRVVSVDGLIQDGRIMDCGVASFVMSKPPLLIQEGSYIPGDLSLKTQKSCLVAAKKIIRALEFDNCGFHCEMKLTKKRGPVLLEIAARPPGGNMLLGYDEAYGISFAESYLDISLGKKVNFRRVKPRKFIVHRGITATQKGILKTIGGLDEISKIKSLKNLTYEKKGNIIDFAFGLPQDLISYRLSCVSREQLKKDEELILRNFKPIFYPKAYFYLKKSLVFIKKNLRKILRYNV